MPSPAPADLRSLTREAGTRALLYVWLFVGIPAAVSIIVNLLFAAVPRRLAERAFALRLKCSSAMLPLADGSVRRKFEEYRREGTDEAQNGQAGGLREDLTSGRTSRRFGRLPDPPWWFFPRLM
jgi:hypothetical protein